MGHEFIGMVEDLGTEVATLKKGDLVVSPFAISDNTCEFCRENLQTSCIHPEANFWDGIPDEGAQAEAIRVPLADGTLIKLPAEPDVTLMPSLLTLSDVFGTGYHAAVAGGVDERTRVTVIGDGAVGLLLCSSRRAASGSLSASPRQDRSARLLQLPGVAVWIGEVGVLEAPLLVVDLADLDSAVDQLGAGGFDIGDDE